MIMSNKINIEEILKKYCVEAIAKKFSHVAIMGNIDSRIKAAIKEIAETVIDKCAEQADTKEKKWSRKCSSGYETGSNTIVNKKSILNVKNLIKYE